MVMQDAHESSDPRAGDIIFECPYCAKGLVIDRRGAGLMITCPDCDERIQVPASGSAGEVERVEAGDAGHAAGGEYKHLDEDLVSSRERVTQLMNALDEMRNRRAYLERLRSDNLVRFEKLGNEIAAIQSALDRMGALLQDAVSESASPPNDPHS